MNYTSAFVAILILVFATLPILVQRNVSVARARRLTHIFIVVFAFSAIWSIAAGLPSIVRNVQTSVRYWQVRNVQESASAKQVADARALCNKNGERLDEVYRDFGPPLANDGKVPEDFPPPVERLIVRCEIGNGMGTEQIMTYLHALASEAR